MRGQETGSGPVPSELVEVLDGGVAIFDPLTWRTQVVSDDAFALIESIRSTVRAGVREPEPLLDILMLELGEPPGDTSLARRVKRENLRSWVSLALHLERSLADE